MWIGGLHSLVGVLDALVSLGNATGQIAVTRDPVGQSFSRPVLERIRVQSNWLDHGQATDAIRVDPCKQRGNCSAHRVSNDVCVVEIGLSHQLLYIANVL